MARFNTSGDGSRRTVMGFAVGFGSGVGAAVGSITGSWQWIPLTLTVSVVLGAFVGAIWRS